MWFLHWQLNPNPNPNPNWLFAYYLVVIVDLVRV